MPLDVFVIGTIDIEYGRAQAGMAGRGGRHHSAEPGGFIEVHIVSAVSAIDQARVRLANRIVSAAPGGKRPEPTS